MEEYWNQRSKTWAEVQPPLKPSVEDLTAFNMFITEHAPDNDIGVILGATPSLYDIPTNTKIVIDFSKEMINISKQANLLKPITFKVENWICTSFKPNFTPVVVGDGVLTMLSYPIDYKHFFNEMSRILVKDGILIIRVFTPGNKMYMESDNVGVEKFRVLMNNVDENYNVNVSKSKHYKGYEDIYYSFPPLNEIFEQAPDFELVDYFIPRYEYGDRFITLCLKKIS